MTPNPDLIGRLRSIPTLRQVPDEELAWLVAHGRLEVYESGPLMAVGEDPEDLFVVLSGRIMVLVDRGLGPRRAAEWAAGDVTGTLPFSRMGKVRNDVLVEVPTEVFSVHQRHFPEMLRECPRFTALTVHTMLDRARRFNASDLQDEKMASLGRLAAGLAHELNNPASAALRGAKLLRSELPDAERASRALCRAGLSEDQIASLEQACAGWLEPSHGTSSLDVRGEIENWLTSRRLDAEYCDVLADTSITVGRLDELATLLPEEALEPALDWLVAASAARAAAADVERAATRIHDLVEAVKRFTNMDRVSASEDVYVEVGLRDTVGMMAPSAEEKGAILTLDVEPDVPPVRAIVSDLNQVWTNLIENALEAVAEGGQIEVTVCRELDRVVVRVIDNGPGIDPKVISRIFDPFFTTKPPGKGMGLGLEVARQLLRRYGGEIGVSSEPGRTEFRVSLNVA